MPAGKGRARSVVVVAAAVAFKAVSASKRSYQLVLANRCNLCDLPKHLHERNSEGDIRVKLDVPDRIEYPDVCQPNPYAARKIVGLSGGETDWSRGLWGRRVAPWP